MKRLIITALCLLLFTTISSGQKRVRKTEWKFVERLENDEAIYIHNKRKFTKSGTIKIWTKIEKFELDLRGIENVGKNDMVVSSKISPPTYDEELEWEKDHLRSKALYEFNCKEETLRVNFVIWYEKGKVITSEQRKEQWKDVVPESSGESLFKAACKK